MILLIILLLPIITGFLILPLRNPATVRIIALISAIANLLITIGVIISLPSATYTVDSSHFMGTQFTLGYDGISLVMILLTNLLFPFIILSGFTRSHVQIPVLNFLILFTQSSLLGVFLAQNAFLFYIFWELTLIPVYFILLLWGGENRKAITLKFFIYTLTGSLFLLFGIIYLYTWTGGLHTTDFSAFNQLHLPVYTQTWLFWILFVAFAIKMPIFPFHTWQPSTYTMASKQGVMILAGVLTKMGIYGALRFLFPIVPQGVLYWQNTVITMCLIGVIYASVIAFRQTNIKRLIAFSSMAHISLMAAAMFALNYYSLQGLLFQVISHGVTIVALFYMVHLIQERTNTLELPLMGGLKHAAPNFAILLLIVMLGSIALPLTAGFVGEFLIITGLAKLGLWIAVLGGTTMILGAIYMLYAYQRIMLGDINPALAKVSDIRTLDYFILIPLIAIILILGIYPQPILDLVEVSVSSMQKLLIPGSEVVTLLLH